MSIEGVNEIKDEKIIKIIETYNKVLGILKQECIKEGVRFMAFGYFRSGDNISEVEGGFYYNHSQLDQFDTYLIEKKMKHLFMYSDEDEDEQ